MKMGIFWFPFFCQNWTVSGLAKRSTTCNGKSTSNGYTRTDPNWATPSAIAGFCCQKSRARADVQGWRGPTVTDRYLPPRRPWTTVVWWVSCAAPVVMSVADDA
jgi:hypothetical protein